MSAMCGPGCGFCGMCTALWEREPDDFEDERDDDPMDPYEEERAAREDYDREER